ncbi:hypothetical protein DSM110277_02021 [Sulfitobacter pontiacus]|uniref:Prophage tail length tape measure protein n=1 Tax=Sulfitobacter pontiacus TaxID=60137 RepID=A0AAX3AEB5_9RHOB|nr:hypothetical protein [Sulfitobacter pontiacus]UOA23592.1 hypothetical protein DSM110277_02021 [Sulfitobacter pontiacus]
MAEPTERIAILLELKQQEFERKAKSAGSAIERLERKYSPLAAAEAKLEKQQLRFNAALEAGTIDAAQHAKGMDLVQREYDQTAARAKHLTNNVVAMNSSVAAQTGFMTRNRSVFQQAGYQIGDFAVQVQGGQSALVAFSQQGSQLLGILGPWGAVMGAVLAVGSSLAGVLWTMGDATEETKEKAKTFTDRLEEADAALSAMSATAGNVTDLEALRQKYGELTEEVREMALALFEIDKREAVAKVSGIIEEVTGEIAKAAEAQAGTVSAALAGAGTDAGRADAEAYRIEIEKIAGIIADRQAAGQFVDPIDIENLRIMREELAAMQGDFANIGSLVDEITISPELLNEISAAQAGLEAARDAGDFSAMADQLGVIRDLLSEAGDTVSQEVLDGVTNAEAQAREMAARLEEGQNAAEGISSADIASGISPAVDEARKLAENLGVSLATARLIAATQAQKKSDLASQYQSYGEGRVAGENLVRENSALYGGDGNVLPEPKVRGASGARGRSSRGREQEPLFNIAEEELEKLKLSIEMLGKSKGEVAELTFRHKMLEEAKKRGMAITDELTAKIDAEAANVGRLADQYDLARDKIAAMEKIQGEFKDGIIDAAMGGADAMDAFTNSIKRAALEYLLFGEGMFAGGGKKSGGFGGIVSAFAGMFDKGGRIPSGQWGIAGENGPEVVRGPAMVTSTRDTARAMQGGSGQMDVRVYVDQDGNWQAAVEKISGGVIRQATPSIQKSTLAATPGYLAENSRRNE